MGPKADAHYAREYTRLMGRNPEGIYLYKPAPYRVCHPGSVGFFDAEGNWNEITDLEQKHRVENAGFKPLNRTLSREDTRDYMWDSRSSDDQSEFSLEGKTELSGVLTSAPIDVGGNAKSKTGKSNTAKLVTGSVVKHERLQAPFKISVKDWINDNAKALVRGDYSDDIKEHGVWVIRATYVTQECAITIDSARSQEYTLGGELGATGLGKLGAGGSSLAKFKGAGWSTYTASERDQGLVVSFSGLHFKLRPFSSMRSVPLREVSKQAHTESAAEKLVIQAIRDDDGNVTGYEHFRVKGHDENGNPILEKIDKEKERQEALEKEKKAEEDNKEAEEEEKRRQDEEFKKADNFMVIDEPVGMSEQELQEEREAEEREKEEQEQQQKERREKSQKEFKEIMEISDETKRRDAVAQWTRENITTTTTVSSYRYK